MSEQQPIPKRRPGGRTADSTRRLYEAVLELLATGGYEAVTFQEVAAQAEVNRSTIYRRWATRTELVFDAIESVAAASVSVPDTGDYRSDLRALLSSLKDFLSSPLGIASLAAGAEMSRTAEVPERRDAFWKARFDELAIVFTRAMEKGQLSTAFDAEVGTAMLGGALFFRIVMMAESIDDQWVERVSNQFFLMQAH
ncbi:TetR/AcrR family transcriptional regulator [Paraburkholderia bannensis]|uniref:TetR/AcrR family transcriptional regulator n=1 Tax=Paraburkholderia bannensis TaxID=765414 RepID=UPI002AB0D82B|nr:TetR/AcrR family transcriptional regulator [Paraburkholderia bannensis]